MTILFGPKHIGMEVDWAIKHYKFLVSNSNNTPEENKEYLIKLKNAGYKMVPCCKNFDKTKGCLGDKKRSK